MENPARAIWILSGCVFAFVVTTCIGVGIVVAFFHDPGQVADITGMEPAAGGSVDRSPRQIQATVTRTTGSSPVVVGSTCSFSVTTQDQPAGGVWCNAQVVCSGRLLYGGPSAGFFNCQLGDTSTRSVVGSDGQTTVQDSDASMSLDTNARTLLISDDVSGSFGAYTLSARIDSVI